MAASGGLAAACAHAYYSPSSSSCEAPAAALSKDEFRPFKLVAREQLTRDTSRYSFALPSEAAELGLPVASCLQVRVPDPAEPGKFLTRPYTPTSAEHARGAFELVVKTYEPNGKVSKACVSAGRRARAHAHTHIHTHTHIYTRARAQATGTLERLQTWPPRAVVLPPLLRMSSSPHPLDDQTDLSPGSLPSPFLASPRCAHASPPLLPAPASTSSRSATASR